MDARLSQGLQAIKKAREYNKEGNYAFARNEYVKGLGLLHQVYQNEKNTTKKEMLRGKMDGYLKEAEVNRQSLQKKELAVQTPWNVFPSKPFNNIRISKNDAKQEPKEPIKETKKQPEKQTLRQTKQIIPKETLKPIPSPKEKQKKVTNHINIHNFVVQPPQNAPAVNQNKLNTKPVKMAKNLALEKVDPQIREFILEDTHVSFKDIANMNDIKKILQQTIILPKLRPDLFQGVREPPRGILLYGPPGNGKTFLAKALATESGCTFFNISASSMVSKFMGDSEKMLRKIFEAAYQTSPSIIFVDQIDSILTSRKESEQDCTRRLKTQFLTQMEGITTTDSDHVVVIGATNMPQQLDKAALRRFAKKVYIGLPGIEARIQMVQRVIAQVTNTISKSELEEIAKKLDNYSASDITAVAAEACQLPVREIQKEVKTIDAKKIRPVTKKDFLETIKNVPPNLTRSEVLQFKLI